MFVALAVVLLLLNKPEIKRLEGIEEYVAEERRKLGKFSVKERNTLIAFGTAVTLWIAPGIVGLIAGTDSSPTRRSASASTRASSRSSPPRCCSSCPPNWGKRQFTLGWDDAVHIDWGVILLFGSGIVLGTLLRHRLAETIGKSLADRSGVNRAAITFLATIVAILISETTSNTASVSDRGADRHPDRRRRRRRPVGAGAGRHLRRLVRLHAAGLDAAERDRLRLGHGPDHQDGPLGVLFDVLGAILIIIGIPLMVSALGIGG